MLIFIFITLTCVEAAQRMAHRLMRKYTQTSTPSTNPSDSNS